MNKKKIFNDPVYGFISIPYNIVYDLIEHPYFQRLRRIKQLGLTHFVYPGALHTRFHHALGALHLMTEAIDVLKSKGIEITDDEAKAVCIAILLHDIGHGPFSHALERKLVNVHHETLSLLFMEELNDIFDGQLALAIRIFSKDYPKKFLSQLVSGQLDMDRLDYLNRDSFFTGVSEGVIGYDRIIKMLNVKHNELVVEEKGIYSIEKFLIARRLMYWQVYLHKTVLSAEQMLISLFLRLKQLFQEKVPLDLPQALHNLFHSNINPSNRSDFLNYYAAIDDIDITAAMKNWQFHSDQVLSILSKSLLNRTLFKAELQNEPFKKSYVTDILYKLEEIYGKSAAEFLLLNGKEANRIYNAEENEIKILYKDGSIAPMSTIVEHGIKSQIISKYYLCYPKNI